MANFFSSLFQRRESGDSGVPASTASSTSSGSAPQATGGNWESQVVRPYGQRSLLVPAWYRGVSLLMQTMGQMRIQYQVKNQGGNNFMEYRAGDAAKFNYLLQVRPNPLMTASTMQEQIEFRKIYAGNAFVYIERDRYENVEALWLCNSGNYNPVTNLYNVTYPGLGGIKVRTGVEPRNILHFKNLFVTDDMLMGIPTITYAFKALTIAATADEKTLQDVATGGRYKVLLTEEKTPTLGTRGRASRKELVNAAEQFEQNFGSRDVILSDNVVDAKILSQTSQQLQLLEHRGHQVSDIARILGVPRIMMMEDQGSNYKLPEHATQEFLLRTIQPRIREHEDEMNSKFFTAAEFGMRQIHICELPLRRLDAKGQAEIDRMHLESGWSVNELRAGYDLPSIEGGDQHYVSANLKSTTELASEKGGAV